MSQLNNWKQIWNKRDYQQANHIDLESLIKLDGFDSGVGRIAATDWQDYADDIAKKLAIFNGASVYELGCGSGAFVYALRNKYALSVGGLDYSAALIQAAQDAMPDGDFIADEAINLATAQAADFVISNSVFHYFTTDYATEVISKMLQKANVAIAILDVPDLATQAESEQIRRDALTQEAYEKKYAGLQHTYYARNWFEALAKQHGCACEVFDGCVPNYAQNPYRFGVIIKKIKH